MITSHENREVVSRITYAANFRAITLDAKINHLPYLTITLGGRYTKQELHVH